VPEEHHFRTGVALIVAGFGSAQEHEQLVRTIRESLPPLFEFVTPLPYTQLQKMLDESALAYEKALYIDELTDEVAGVFAEHLPRKTALLSVVPVFHLGGAYRSVPDDATAFGGSRVARINLNIAAVCGTPEELASDRAWVRSFWNALRSHASNAGGYVNFMTEMDEDRVRVSYGPAKYERLSRIKAQYDPDNVFHRNANIKPALQPV
jgi:hypothetical protein